MASSDFCGVVWTRAHAGLADMSMVRNLGLSPVKTTLPVTVAALASSTARRRRRRRWSGFLFFGFVLIAAAAG